MAVYDGEEYLQQALESILTQTLKEFEFIIVNDGSTDKSASILSRYHDSDDRVKIFDQQHQGLARALNFGVHQARGKYIARMDADDIALPDRFERQVSFLESNPKVAVLGSAARNILSDGTVLETPLLAPLANAQIKTMLRTYNCILHCTAMIRKPAFLKVGGYREAFICSQDYDLWLRMSERYRLANLPDVLMYYRLHYNQASIRKIEQQMLGDLAAQAASRARLATGIDPLQLQKSLTRALLNQMGVTDKTINDKIISRYREIMTSISRVPLPMKDKEHLDSFVSEALEFITSVGEDESWLHELCSRV
jgi:glycosyltransferase involved in cell wall biosynthesis